LRIAIKHTTHYQYGAPPAHGLTRLRLMPKTTHGQHIVSWTMDLAGAAIEAEYDDQHANRTTLISLEPDGRTLEVTCSGVVDTVDNAGILGPHVGYMPLWVFCQPTPLTRPGPGIRALANRVVSQEAGTLEMLHALSAAVLDLVDYRIGETSAETSAEQAVAAGAGVCQDHAHVFIAAARLRGIPARYVSGYLLLDDRVEQDAGHAWAEAHVAGLGWVGFDISNQISPDERYVRVATGCDYSEAAPITGMTLGGSGGDLSVKVAVAQQSIEQ